MIDLWSQTYKKFCHYHAIFVTRPAKRDQVLLTSNHSRKKTFAVHHWSLICREDFCSWELWFTANPKTTHTPASSVYGVLKLEESRFTHVLWQKKQNWQFCVQLSCVPRELDDWRKQLVCEREEEIFQW